jgi:hypothetical protein
MWRPGNFCGMKITARGKMLNPGVKSTGLGAQGVKVEVEVQYAFYTIESFRGTISKNLSD